MKMHTLDLDFLGLSHSIAVFVVETAQGLALVECGPGATLPHLKELLAQNGWQLSDFHHLFLSHIHFDHAGAAWALADAGAMVYVHPVGLPHLAAPEKLYNSARMIYGDDMDRLWGEMRPVAQERLYAPAHGESIQAIGCRFTAWHTPGHAIHHIAWEVRPENGGEAVVFTGDVAGVRIEGGPVMPPCPPPDIHIEDWQASLQLLRELDAQRLILTHFGETGDKLTHLDELERRLLAWAEWMRPHAEQQADPAALVPAFKAYVQASLLEAGVSQENIDRYEAANPAFMSVAGLMRYWKKKLPR